MTNPEPKPRGVVVIVEDDDITRAVLSESLTEAGFNVIEAVDADDANMLLEHGATGIHALVTDNSMPGSMNGIKLARLAREKWPWINLVVAAQLVDPGASLPPGCRYFPKPYRVAHILEHLQTVGQR